MVSSCRRHHANAVVLAALLLFALFRSAPGKSRAFASRTLSSSLDASARLRRQRRQAATKTRRRSEGSAELVESAFTSVSPRNCSRPGVHLTEDAFSGEFATGLSRDVVVFFYRPGCPFCEAFDPVWRCIVDDFSTPDYQDQVIMARFPASEYPSITNQYAIEGFPTIRFFPKRYMHSSDFLGADYPQEANLDFEAVIAFIRALVGKSAAQIVNGVPAANTVQIGSTPGGHDIVRGGMAVTHGSLIYDSPALGSHVATLFVSSSDKSQDCGVGKMAIDAAEERAKISMKAWSNRGLSEEDRRRKAATVGDEELPEPPTTFPGCSRFGTCLSLERNQAPDVCSPFVTGGSNHSEYKFGIQRVWWGCSSAGLCQTTWKLHTAPAHVRFDLTHTCGGAPAKGVRIGTVAGVGDVVNDETGLVQTQWLQPNPAAQVPSDMSETVFFLESAADSGGLLVRSSIVLSSSQSSVLDVDLHGTGDRIFRDSWGELSTKEAEAPPKPLGYSGKKRGLRNAALGRPVMMTSTWVGDNGVFATDGKFTQCALTNKEGTDPQPFLEVDLGGKSGRNSIIKSVRLWNADSADLQSRIMPFWIMIFEDDLTPTKGKGSKESVYDDTVSEAVAKARPRALDDAIEQSLFARRFSKPRDGQRVYEWLIERNDVRGRYVRVQLERTEFLQVAELEVFVLDKNRQCSDPISPGLRHDPECVALPALASMRAEERRGEGVSKPLSMRVRYKCLKPGNSMVSLTVPMYPEYAPMRPPFFSWTKSCTSKVMDHLAMGNPQGGDPVGLVMYGVPREGYAPWPDPYAKDSVGPPFPPRPPRNATIEEENIPHHIAKIPGHVNQMPLNIRLMQRGLTQKIRRHIDVTSLTIVTPTNADAGGANGTGISNNSTKVLVAEEDSSKSRVPGSNRSKYLEFTNDDNIVLFPAVLINGDGSGFSVLNGGKEVDTPMSAQQTGLVKSFRRRRLLEESGDSASVLPEQEASLRGDAYGHDIDEGDENTATLSFDPLDARLIFGCVRTGEALVTLNVTFAPIWQPYRPTLLTMRKRCGGRRHGLHVFESVKIEDEEGKPTGRTRPAPEGGATTVMRNGVPQEGFIPGHLVPETSPSGKKRKDFRRVPGEETTTTFYVRVPVVELDAALGNTSVVPKKCHHDGGRLCRQLPLTTLGTPAVSAKCVPNVCSPNMLGVGTSGPALAGEVLGDTPASIEQEPWTQAGDLVPLKISYHCTRATEVEVTVTISPSFYEPMMFSYKKMCAPSVWRVVALVGIGLTLSVGIGALILCLPCPCWRGDSLLKRIVQGDSMPL